MVDRVGRIDSVVGYFAQHPAARVELVEQIAAMRKAKIRVSCFGAADTMKQ